MKAHRAAGFTLLEILIVLAVFGLLLAGLSQTVRFGLVAWRQDARLSAGKVDLEAVDRSLRSVVTNFQPEDESAQPSMTGSANALTGISRFRIPGSGLNAVPVEAGIAVSGTHLVLRWRPYHHATLLGAAPPAGETELMDGIARLQIEYWQPSGSWVSQWRQPDLPLLVRFRLSFAGEHPPRWPDIVVAPRLSRP